MTADRARREVALLVALLAAAGLAFTYVIAVRTPLGQRLDTQAMLDVSAALAGQSWTSTVLSLVSPTMVVAAAALALAAGAWRGARTACAVLAISGGTIAAAAVLKTVLVRPEFLNDSSNSLPSGHVAAIAGLSMAAIFAVAPRYRVAAAVLSAVGLGLTGLATLALQWHRPSDVLAATLVAVMAGALVTAAAVPGPPHPSALATGHVLRFSEPSSHRSGPR